MASFGRSREPDDLERSLENLQKTLKNYSSELSRTRCEKAYLREISKRQNDQHAWVSGTQGMEAYIQSILTARQAQRHPIQRRRREVWRHESDPKMQQIRNDLLEASKASFGAASGHKTKEPDKVGHKVMIRTEKDLEETLEEIARVRTQLFDIVGAYNRRESASETRIAELEELLRTLYTKAFPACFPVKKAHRKRAARIIASSVLNTQPIQRPRSAIGRPRPSSEWLLDLQQRQVNALPHVHPRTLHNFTK